MNVPTRAALAGCAALIASNRIPAEEPRDNSAKVQGKYANVNGLKMYYEIHGAGKPLVLRRF